MKKNCLFLFLFTLIILSSNINVLLASTDSTKNTPKKILTLNPYESVNWQTINQYKANFHTHTKVSDGAFKPHEAIDLYHQAGYKILALTDHVPDWSGNNYANILAWPWQGLAYLSNTVNWDWTWENRDPASLGMLAVQGSEPSSGHHRGSFFNGLSDPMNDLNYTFSAITQLGGLAMLYHPGREWKIYQNYLPYDMYSLEWYEMFYNTYPVLVGMEVYNQGNRYPNDRILWDELLTRMMPQRPIWGFSNDDMHSANDLFKCYNFMLMENLEEQDLKNSMKIGTSFFSYEYTGSGNTLTPSIDSIIIDKTNHLIHIYAQNYDSIAWISGVDSVGAYRTSRIIAMGDSLPWSDFNYNYVRAQLINSFGRTYTQPFGFEVKPPDAAAFINGPQTICLGMDTITYTVPIDNLAELYHWELPPNAIFIGDSTTHSIKADFSNVTVPGIISVWKENLSGLSDTIHLLIDIVPNTIPGYLTGNDTICKGDSILPLALSGFLGNITWQGTYTGINWFNMQGNDSIYSPGLFDYDVTFRAKVKKDNCPEKYSNTVFVKINPIPTTPIISLINSILVSNTINGNQWYDSNGPIQGETLQYYIPNSNGEYSVIVTENNCSSQPASFLYMITDINDLESYGISVFPNPNQGKLYIKLNSNPSGETKILLFNVKGALLKEQHIGNHIIETEFDMSSYSNGIYVLKFVNDNYSIIHRVMLTK